MDTLGDKSYAFHQCKHGKILLVCLVHYRLQTKLEEGNVFSRVYICQSVWLQREEGFHMAITHDVLDPTVQGFPLHPVPNLTRTWDLTVQAGGAHPVGILSCCFRLLKCWSLSWSFSQVVLHPN